MVRAATRRLLIAGQDGFLKDSRNVLREQGRNDGADGQIEVAGGRVTEPYRFDGRPQAALDIHCPQHLLDGDTEQLVVVEVRTMKSSVRMPLSWPGKATSGLRPLYHVAETYPCLAIPLH